MHKSDQALYREVMEDCALGASVLVLPWYHPLRLAEEIAMLNSTTRGTPIELRQHMMTRFAEDVCPRCSSTMRRTRAA